MKPRKKSAKICGRCSSAESTSWHRQRGNNKYFCKACQENKTAAKQENEGAPANSESGDGCSTTRTEVSRFPSNLEEEDGSNSVELGISKPSERNTSVEISDFSDQQSQGNSASDQTTPCDEQKPMDVVESTDINKEMEKVEEASSTAPKSPDNEANNGDCVKKQKSPISHPRLTRLRSSTRPTRAAALAAANKNQPQNEKQEKQSHSRSSSAAGFTSKSGTNGGRNSDFVVPRNKGRRHILKLSKPEKASYRRASTTTSDHLWHKGQLYRQSDVVGVIDEKDENIYYASIRGLVRDEYCQQYAVLTWLIPTTGAPLDRSFDFASYVLGPEDETFYPLDSVEFICHIPNDYFQRRGATLSAISAAFPRTVGPAPALNPKNQFAGMT